ncbi:MAG: hypothetical protein H0W01_04800, partial [Pseudonocardiales bacterium]|nr:hypothetical protein [Pseudonocardiales bacterium]
MTATMCLAQDPAADALLDRDPLALLVGMVLDQQIPLEHAFSSPHVLVQRLGHDLDAHQLADFDPDELAAVFARPRALHRFPRSMAGRVQQVCRALVERYDGDVAGLWRDASDGRELLARVKALPGFGEQKARIFVALLGKQRGPWTSITLRALPRSPSSRSTRWRSRAFSRSTGSTGGLPALVDS